MRGFFWLILLLCIRIELLDAQDTAPSVLDFFTAVKHGDIQNVELYLRRGGDINAIHDRCTAICIAMARSVSAQATCPAELWEARAQAEYPMVYFLMQRGADINEALHQGTRNDTPLMDAARNGRKNLLCRYLEHGVNVRAVNDEGWSALAWAVNYYQLRRDDGPKASIIMLLLYGGIYVEYPDVYMRGPVLPELFPREHFLVWAVFNNYIDAVLYLLPELPKPEELEYSGCCAYIDKAKICRKNSDYSRRIIHALRSVRNKFRDELGMSLALSIGRGNSIIVERLLTYADPHAQIPNMPNGWTPATLANRIFKRTDITQEEYAQYTEIRDAFIQPLALRFKVFKTLQQHYRLPDEILEIILGEVYPEWGQQFLRSVLSAHP